MSYPLVLALKEPHRGQNNLQHSISATSNIRTAATDINIFSEMHMYFYRCLLTFGVRCLKALGTGAEGDSLTYCIITFGYEKQTCVLVHLR